MINIAELLKTSTETEVLEFKEAKFNYDTDKLGRYFSALSNEANLKGNDRAYLLFGVKNDKTIVGTSIADKEINNFKHEISQNTSPTLSFIDVERHEVDGKSVLCFIIPAAPRGMPIAWKDHYYGREGESLGGLDLGEIDRIRNQTKNKDWSVQVVNDASIDDLSPEAIEFARKQYAEKNQRLKDEIPKWSDKVFLNRARLTIDGKITNAAILLLGKPESEHFLTPALARITWILKDRDGVEKDYEHFSCPLILSVQQVFQKIRNNKYRYMQEGTLFPEEVLQYDPYSIRESLNNCIAHQDYTMGGKINVVENEDGFLLFSNAGDFIPKTIDRVINSDGPENIYRNPFLVAAMVNLNMIDSVGSGIRRMFMIQKDRFFPLPEFDLENHSVKLTLTGKILDLNYTRKLASDKELSLREIILLDKVQKRKTLGPEEFKLLKSKKLVEGRKNCCIIASGVAKKTNQETDYMKLKGIDDDYCKKMILDYIKKFGRAKRVQLEEMLLEKLPDILSEEQKKNKIKNVLQSLKRNNKIRLDESSASREWILV